MPARYEAIRNKFVKGGMNVRDAKTRAAKIYNKTRKPAEPKLTNKHRQSTGDIMAAAYKSRK